MDTELLKVFLVIAEEESISGAAERLHFSQPAASKRLQTLEKAIGQELFLRHNRGVELTPAGQRVARFARRVLQLEEGLILDLEALNRPEPKTIEIVATQFVSMSVLSCLLWSFQQEHPHITVRVTTAHAETALRLIKENSAQLALIEGPIHDPDLATHPVGREPLVLVCSPTVACDLKDRGVRVPVLLPESGSGIRRMVEAAAESGRLPIDLEEFTGSETLRDLQAIKIAALSGLSRVLLPRMLVQKEILEEKLVLCPTVQHQPLCELPYAFVWRRERTLSPEYREVMEQVARCAAPIPVGRVRQATSSS